MIFFPSTGSVPRSVKGTVLCPVRHSRHVAFSLVTPSPFSGLFLCLIFYRPEYLLTRNTPMQFRAAGSYSTPCFSLECLRLFSYMIWQHFLLGLSKGSSPDATTILHLPTGAVSPHTPLGGPLAHLSRRGSSLHKPTSLPESLGPSSLPHLTRLISTRLSFITFSGKLPPSLSS